VRVYGYNGTDIKIVFKNETIKLDKIEVENITKQSITNTKKADNLKSAIASKTNRLQNNIDIHYEKGIISMCVGVIHDKWWINE
ncbi:unnamed protein product, partial [marine sediment metagenome]